MTNRTVARLSGLAALLAMALIDCSCATWRRQWVGPEWVIQQEHPKQVLVTRKDGTGLVFTNPVVVQDSLVGAVGEERQSIALAEVEHLSLRRGNALLPAVLLPLGVLFGLGVWVAASWN